jgi:hypothetical protein
MFRAGRAAPGEPGVPPLDPLRRSAVRLRAGEPLIAAVGDRGNAEGGPCGAHACAELGTLFLTR